MLLKKLLSVAVGDGGVVAVVGCWWRLFGDVGDVAVGCCVVIVGCRCCCWCW